MIELRFPTPDELKSKLLNEYAEGEELELVNQGNFVCVELPKIKLARFNRFVTENEIAKAEDIEEVVSSNIIIHPPDKAALFLKYAKENCLDFTLSAYAKIHRKNFDAFVRFLIDNEISDE